MLAKERFGSELVRGKLVEYYSSLVFVRTWLVHHSVRELKILYFGRVTAVPLVRLQEPTVYRLSKHKTYKTQEGMVTIKR